MSTSFIDADGTTRFRGRLSPAPGGAVQVVGPITVTAAEVIAGWDTDHGDVTTAYSLPAGAILYDVLYRVTAGFDSDNVNSMFPFVGGAGSEEFFNDPGASDPIVSVSEVGTGTLIDHAPSWGGGSSSSPHHTLSDTITGNDGSMPVFVLATTPLRFRFGISGVATAQPVNGSVDWYLVILLPTAP
jgi:hypothetical protein